jgi:iron-chelate-transporting ATPase
MASMFDDEPLSFNEILDRIRKLAVRFCDEIIALHSDKVIARGTPDATVTPTQLQAIYGIPMGVMPRPGGEHLIGFVG